MLAFFNIGSVVFGLAAWVLPIVAKGRTDKSDLVKFIVASFASCAISIVLQLFEIQRRVQLNDFSAIMDTIGTVCWVSLALVVITTLLNYSTYKTKQ